MVSASSSASSAPERLAAMAAFTSRSCKRYAAAVSAARSVRLATALASCSRATASSLARQHFLYLLPLPHGQGSLGPVLAIVVSTYEPRRTHPLYRDVLTDATFHQLLLACDRDLADTARGAGSKRCNGVVHSAHYWRKPRGRPCRLGREHDRRFSFCCAVDGCRSRATPPSLRFLGPKVYIAAIVVLIATLRHGATALRMRELTEGSASIAAPSSAGAHGGVTASPRHHSGRSLAPRSCRRSIRAGCRPRSSSASPVTTPIGWSRCCASWAPSLEAACTLDNGLSKSAEDARREPSGAAFTVAALSRRSAGMTRQTRGPRVHERWAHLRFSVIGQLLAAPPAKGELKAAIEGLAGRIWQHPSTGKPVCFGFSTIEHWYYRALKERTDPVGVLRRKVRANAGRQHAISDAVRQVVLAQYAAHKSWSVQLHHDNLVALAETRPELKPMPSYPTLRRFMRVNGLDKRRRVTSRQTDGADRAEDKLADREIRGYEAEYVGSLWHWDCHHGSKKVLTGRGEWVTPITAEITQGLTRLGILHQT